MPTNVADRPSERGPVAAPLAVTVLTLCWLAAVAALLWKVFALGMEAWGAGASSNGDDRTAALHVRTAHVSLWLAGIGAFGPAVIAAVAAGGRMVRTSVVYFVLAALLALPAAFIARDADRTLNPRAPVPSGPTHCIEHSGGDNRCPGG